jgi:hypothetical protein
MMQTIVDALSYSSSTTTRLVHIYGAGGTGKSYLAKHVAKYLFERRNFDFGCINIELKNKYAVGENLTSLICNALGIATAEKNILCKYITKCKLLIILDQSSKVDLDKNLLNRTLNFFIEETEMPKFLVITENKADITIQEKLAFETDELDERNAARLLLLCANQYIEQYNKDLDVLSKHEIFSLISRNPSSIIRFSQFMKTCSGMLEDIVKKQKNKVEQFNKSTNHQKEETGGIINEDWSWVIKQSYESLSKSYSQELIILFVLCQLPSGMLDSDFHSIFHETVPKWKEFLEILMKFKERILNDAKERISNLEFDTETFWLVTFKTIAEINQRHYVPYQIVYSYVNKSIISEQQRQDA